MSSTFRSTTAVSSDFVSQSLHFRPGHKPNAKQHALKKNLHCSYKLVWFIPLSQSNKYNGNQLLPISPNLHRKLQQLNCFNVSFHRATNIHNVQAQLLFFEAPLVNMKNTSGVAFLFHPFFKWTPPTGEIDWIQYIYTVHHLVYHFEFPSRPAVNNPKSLQNFCHAKELCILGKNAANWMCKSGQVPFYSQSLTSTIQNRCHRCIKHIIQKYI